jgi:limonene-1,2-epoxide hydrolase
MTIGRFKVSDAVTKRNEQAVEVLFKALSGPNPDYETVRAAFADDAYYWALTPVSPQRHGPQAIVDDLKRQLAMAGDLKSEAPIALVSSNNHVVLERTDFVTVAHTGKRAGVRICSVFEFDDAGKITAWREYFDKAYCEQQMGFGGSTYAPANAG